jgi:competence ComEA-like helix-hairpin-helix protein
MGWNTFVTKLQATFGVTKSELLVVFVLVAGLLAGTLVQFFSKDSQHDNRNKEVAEIVYHSLDSLAETQRTAYIGTDVKDSSYKELADADTIVKKGFFPERSRKAQPGVIINLNTASKVQLMRLPGVGEKTAIKIIEYRKSSPFRRAEDIMKIKGIGAKKFAKMKEFIQVK